jgi:molybdopterin-guanine dinucleotide biosynthesis protein B
LLFPDDPAFIAIATDAPLAMPVTLPSLDLNQPPAIADFIINYCFIAPGQAHLFSQADYGY